MGGIIGTRAAEARAVTPRRSWRAWALAVSVALTTFAVPAQAALASATPFTWTGESESSDRWSAAANWEGGVAPSASDQISGLTFPRLTSKACTLEEEEHECYFSENSVSGLSAESMELDDGDPYFIAGEELALGAGGLTVAPGAGSSGPAGDYLFMPFHLTATQTWSIAGHSGGRVAENGILVGEEVKSSPTTALTVRISNETEPFLESNIEVGPLTIAGADPSKAGVLNGALALIEGGLNALDGKSVKIAHVFLVGTGAVGPLSTEEGEITIGAGGFPAEGLEAASAKLGSGSRLGFQITGPGSTADEDYAQLTSTGAVELANATFEAIVRPPEPGEPCPVLKAGETFTFISTSGALSGEFANAPEGGPGVPITFAETCSPKPAQVMRIHYNTGGPTDTVTGTVEESPSHEGGGPVVGPPPPPPPPAAIQQALEAAERKRVEEAAAAKKLEEERAALAVAGFHASTSGAVPDARLASTSLTASSSGAVTVKVSCPAAETVCTGTITLRTAGAVSARLAGAVSSRRSVLTLAAGSFKVAGGKVEAVSLHLSRKARVLLARVHTLRVRATILAHDTAGATHTGQSLATLRAARPRHGKG